MEVYNYTVNNNADIKIGDKNLKMVVMYRLPLVFWS